jgi:hypothetical protein
MKKAPMYGRILLAAFFAFATSCNRYEWKPDYLVPEICPPAKAPVAPPARIDPEVALIGSSIGGRVIRADAALPIAGVRVEVTDLSLTVQTDSTGHFHFDSVTPGRHVMRVRSVGFKQWQDTVKIVLDQRPELTLKLTLVGFDGPCSGFELVRVRKPWWKFW